MFYVCLGSIYKGFVIPTTLEYLKAFSICLFGPFHNPNNIQLLNSSHCMTWHFFNNKTNIHTTVISALAIFLVPSFPRKLQACTHILHNTFKLIKICQNKLRPNQGPSLHCNSFYIIAVLALSCLVATKTNKANNFRQLFVAGLDLSIDLYR